ncbi:MAG: hypothetical protein FJ109_21415 [Deltaproteobacteria bacterium]|nr:hypothetical protein [Deltaproteobacteria bacterium]
MLIELLESVGKALVRSAFLAMLNAVHYERHDAAPKPQQWFPQLPGLGADPILLEHLDRLDLQEYEANLRLQRCARDDYW